MTQKITVYFEDELYAELKEAADLQQRSTSWLIQHAWRLSRGRILDYPSVTTGDDVYAS